MVQVNSVVKSSIGKEEFKREMKKMSGKVIQSLIADCIPDYTKEIWIGSYYINIHIHPKN